MCHTTGYDCYICSPAFVVYPAHGWQASIYQFIGSLWAIKSYPCLNNCILRIMINIILISPRCLWLLDDYIRSVTKLQLWSRKWIAEFVLFWFIKEVHLIILATHVLKRKSSIYFIWAPLDMREYANFVAFCHSLK